MHHFANSPHRGNDETGGQHSASAAVGAQTPGETWAFSLVVNQLICYLLDHRRPVPAQRMVEDLGIEHEELYAHLVKLDQDQRIEPRRCGVDYGHRMGWVAV